MSNFLFASVLVGKRLNGSKGVLDIENPGHDDFELWSPSEERTERCLFGRQASLLFRPPCYSIDDYDHQTLYHRRVRNASCVVGHQPKAETRVVSNCPCAKTDFEW